MIRKAVIQDVKALVQLGFEAVAQDPIGVPSVRAMSEEAVRAVSAADCFCWVSEVNGKVEGAVTAFTLPISFHKGRMLQVVQFYCRAPAKGDGLKMLREMVKWADSRPIIRMTVITVELDADKRIFGLLGRLGFVGEQMDMVRTAPSSEAVG